MAQTGTPRTKFLVPSIGSITHCRWLCPVDPCSSPRTASRERTRERVRRIASSTAWSASVTGVRSGLLITCRSRALKRFWVMESASSASTWARRRSSVKSTDPDPGPEIGMRHTLWGTEPNSPSIRTMRRDCLRGPAPHLGNGMVDRRPTAAPLGRARRGGVHAAGGVGSARVRLPRALPRPPEVADPRARRRRRALGLGGVLHRRQLLQQRPLRQLLGRGAGQHQDPRDIRQDAALDRHGVRHRDASRRRTSTTTAPAPSAPFSGP